MNCFHNSKISAVRITTVNSRYVVPPEEKTDFMAPFRRKADFGGVVAFPLMVPVKPTDKYVEDFRNARIFLGKFPKTNNNISYFFRNLEKSAA